MRSILQSGSRISSGSSGWRACLISILMSGLWGAAIAQTNAAGIGSKYDPFTLQSRWVRPGARGGGTGAPPSARAATTAKVTLPSGESFSGTLEGISDFSVSLKDASGDLHSFDRDGDVPKVEINDPLRTHKAMLRQYTDADIHDVTAYLVALK